MILATIRRSTSVLGVLLLAACGQSGPLYLPDQAPPKHGLSVKPDTRSPADENAQPAPRSVPALPPASSTPNPPTPPTP